MADLEVMYFESPNGAIRPLDAQAGTGVFAMWGIQGRFMPTYEFDTQEMGLYEGVKVTGVKILPRTVQVPVRIEGATDADFDEVFADLSYEFDPIAGDGRLYTTTRSDKMFYLNCRYAKGMEISEESEYGRLGANAAIEFFAADPYWYSTASISASAQAVTTGKAFFSDPWFPVEFGSSQVLDNFEIFNPGSRVWPIITVTGPTDSIVIEDKYSGLTIWIDTEIAAGQTLEIDTRPEAKSILLDGSINYYQYRRLGSRFFPLVRGMNRLRVELTGADENSSIDVTAFDRYLVPR